MPKLIRKRKIYALELNEADVLIKEYAKCEKKKKEISNCIKRDTL